MLFPFTLHFRQTWRTQQYPPSALPVWRHRDCWYLTRATLTSNNRTNSRPNLQNRGTKRERDSLNQQTNPFLHHQNIYARDASRCIWEARAKQYPKNLAARVFQLDPGWGWPGDRALQLLENKKATWKRCWDVKPWGSQTCRRTLDFGTRPAVAHSFSQPSLPLSGDAAARDGRSAAKSLETRVHNIALIVHLPEIHRSQKQWFSRKGINDIARAPRALKPNRHKQGSAFNHSKSLINSCVALLVSALFQWFFSVHYAWRA